MKQYEQLFFSHNWSFRHMTVFIILLTAAIYLHWRSAASLSSIKARIGLIAIRTLIAAVIIFLILQPSLVLRKLEKRKNRIALLLDTSMSMEIKSKNGKRNIDKAVNLLTQKKGIIEKLRQNFEIDFYMFSDTMKRINRDQITDSIATDGERTDIINAISEIMKNHKEKSALDRIIIVSDGTDNVLFDENLLTLPYADIKNIVRLNTKDIRIPVTGIWIGIDNDFKDIFTANVFANEFGFVKNPFTIGAKIIVKGYSDTVVPVILKEGEKIISAKNIKIVEGKDTYIVEFSFTPEKVGEHLYTVYVPLLSQEALRHNNKKSIKINIMRDRLRIMLVMGSPSWDGKFLRRFLKGEPYVDLITFIILRTNRNLFTIPVKELSLIPFPTDELFQKDRELNKFDIIIFLNFGYQQFIPFNYLKNIEEFVTKKGGGFLMIGGRRSFRGGGYRGTPIENILPVELKYDLADTVEPAFIEDPFRVRLTKTGKRHPILKWENSIRETDAVWRNMSSLHGFNSSLRPKKGTKVLAEHADKGNSYGKYPIIAAMEAGRGRSMMIASDSLWRLNFLSAARGGDTIYSNRFWSNAIKWLTFDPEFKRIKIYLHESAKRKGKKVSFDVSVQDSSWQPSWKLNLKAILITPENRKKSISLKRGNERGKYTAYFIPDKNGIYEAEVKTSEEKAHLFITIGETERESEYISINGSIIKALAEISGGQFYNINDNKPSISFETQEQYIMIDEKVISLWDNWYFLSTVIGLLSLEWYWRRKKGLI